MRILEYKPIIPFIWVTPLALERLLSGLEVDRMPHVLNAFEQIGHGRAPPPIGVGKVFVFSIAATILGKIIRGASHLFSLKLCCNGIWPHALNRHGIHAAHDLGGGFVNDPLILVRFGFFIPV